MRTSEAVPESGFENARAVFAPSIRLPFHIDPPPKCIFRPLPVLRILPPSNRARGGMPRGGATQKNPYRSDTPSTGSRRRVVHHAAGAGGQREKNFTPFRGEGLCCPARKNLHYLLRSGFFATAATWDGFLLLFRSRGISFLTKGPLPSYRRRKVPGERRGPTTDRAQSIPFSLFRRGHVVEAMLGVPLGT